MKTLQRLCKFQREESKLIFRTMLDINLSQRKGQGGEGGREISQIFFTKKIEFITWDQNATLQF